MGLTLREEIARRFAAVEERIGEAAGRSGRSRSDVLLVAVSKTFPIDVIVEAVAAGVTDLGENRAQEFREKVAVLGERARWHFIGNLQTNKVRFVVGSAVLIHSVDRYGLAEAIARRAVSLGVRQDILMEVNVSGEPSKHGVEPARALHLAEEIAQLDGVKLRGVMTMAPFSDDPESSRPYFQDLKALSDRLREAHPDASEISMGMTRDLEVGVEEGATVVRVGEAIFGPRSR